MNKFVKKYLLGILISYLLICVLMQFIFPDFRDCADLSEFEKIKYSENCLHLE